MLCSLAAGLALLDAGINAQEVAQLFLEFADRRQERTLALNMKKTFMQVSKHLSALDPEFTHMSYYVICPL